jgi:hypothetical protein
LNGSKFPRNWVRQTLPTALHAVASIAGIELTDQNRSYVRGLAWMTGGVARDALVAMSASGQLTAPVGPDSPSAPETFYGLAQVVFRELYRKLFKRNKRLFNPLRGSHNVGEALQNAGSGDWENIFVPVTTEEL